MSDGKDYMSSPGRIFLASVGASNAGFWWLILLWIAFFGTTSFSATLRLRYTYTSIHGDADINEFNQSTTIIIPYYYWHFISKHGCVRKPVGKLWRRRKTSDEDKKALFEQLVRSGRMYQDEIVYWLDVERDVVVNHSTVARLLRKNDWTRRTLRPLPTIRRNFGRAILLMCARLGAKT